MRTIFTAVSILVATLAIGQVIPIPNDAIVVFDTLYATLHYQSAGGDNTIYYESGAILDTTGPIGYNFFIESMDIIFDYSDAPKHGCSVSGIQENATAMQAYPNPTTGVVYFTFPGDASLTVFNAVGQVLLTSGQSCTVDLAQYGFGWYVVQVTGDQVITKAILVR